MKAVQAGKSATHDQVNGYQRACHVQKAANSQGLM